MLARLRGWKTIIFSGFLGLIGIVLTVLQAVDVVQIMAVLPDKYKPFAPLVLAFIGAIVAGLRFVTTGPVGDKS